MSERIDKHAEHLEMVERGVSEAEDEQVTASGEQKQLEKAVTALQAKAKDLEACSNRNNLRIVGLVESINGGVPSH
ncbi:hypothetical protein NDU88_006177 [Pleurodeles waltl]|uniref:Uncharacterized protein n=1 Tax=Pleurodeles waltl TaxID=8319 RepID=A0AAV7RL60_PLEWA|nr:hypothetical protein NDU88_006177 [Pleurodeles waltl]